jgi:transcription initiation factor IIE alpha subunit
MGRVRAYSREERKRLIIYVLAEAIRKGNSQQMTATQIAREMDIVPSTKLRKILAEMVTEKILQVEDVEDAGIAGFRYLYYLNGERDGFAFKHPSERELRKNRTIRLNIGGKVEALSI